MSAHMKMLHTKKSLKKDKQRILHMKHGQYIYSIPKDIADRYKKKENKKTKLIANSVPASKIFAELDKQYTKAGVLMKGIRYREGLNQTEFAKTIGVTQADLSKMENGKRPIGKNIAKRVAQIYGINYRLLLE